MVILAIDRRRRGRRRRGRRRRRRGRSDWWAVATCCPLRLGVALRPLANALRIKIPPGPLALKVLTIFRVEVLGALVRVRGTLILARRLPRELPLACRRRRRRRRRGRGRRRRRRCAHVTVIPGLAWRVSNALDLRAAPGTRASIGVAAVTAWHTAWLQRGIMHGSCVYMLCIHDISRFD